MGGTSFIAATGAARCALGLEGRMIQLLSILAATASVPAAAGQDAMDTSKSGSAADSSGPSIPMSIWVPICGVNTLLACIMIQYIRLQRHRTKRTSLRPQQLWPLTGTPPSKARPSDAGGFLGATSRESMPLPALPTDSAMGVYQVLSKATRVSAAPTPAADRSIYETPFGHHESSSDLIYERIDDVFSGSRASPPPVYSSSMRPDQPPAAPGTGHVRERPPTTPRLSRPSLDGTYRTGGTGTTGAFGTMMVGGFQPGSPAALAEPDWAGIAASSGSSVLADCWDDDDIDSGVASTSTVSLPAPPMPMLVAAHSAHAMADYTNVVGLVDCSGDDGGDRNFYVDLLQHDDVVRLQRSDAAVVAAAASLGPDPAHASPVAGPLALSHEHLEVAAACRPTSPHGLVQKATVRLSLGAAGPPGEPGEYLEVLGDARAEADRPVPFVVPCGQGLFYSATAGPEPPASTHHRPTAPI